MADENVGMGFMRVEFDELDRQIMHFLRRDGRRKYSDIARQVGSSEPTVHRRLDRLLQTGAVYVTAHVRPAAVGQPVHVMVFVRAQVGLEEEVGRQLAETEEVAYLAFVAGDSDIVLEAYLQNEAVVLQFLSKVVGGVSGVLQADMLRILRVVRSSWSWEGENAGRDLLPQLRDHLEANSAQVPSSDVETARVDGLDRGIIGHLRADGRRRYVDMSRDLGASTQTIRNRVERLLQKGVIEIVARVRPEAIGFPITVLLRLRVRRGAIFDVSARLAGMPLVSSIICAAGICDMVIEANLPTVEHLLTLLHEDLAAVQDIEQVETLQVLSVLKRNHMWKGESKSLGERLTDGDMLALKDMTKEYR